MPQIIYDRTWYHDANTYIMQALDPCNTFEEAVKQGEVTRENAGRVAYEYLEWVIRENAGDDMDPDDWRAATLTEEHLEAYLRGIIDRIA